MASNKTGRRRTGLTPDMIGNFLHRLEKRDGVNQSVFEQGSQTPRMRGSIRGTGARMSRKPKQKKAVHAISSASPPFTSSNRPHSRASPRRCSGATTQRSSIASDGSAHLTDPRVRRREERMRADHTCLRAGFSCSLQ
jgi:hypothetical protein